LVGPEEGFGGGKNRRLRIGVFTLIGEIGPRLGWITELGITGKLGTFQGFRKELLLKGLDLFGRIGSRNGLMGRSGSKKGRKHLEPFKEWTF